MIYIDLTESGNATNHIADLERLNKALVEQWDLKDLECDLRVLQTLQKALREGQWKVTVSVHRGQVLTNAWPGFVDRAYGLAVDVVEHPQRRRTSRHHDDHQFHPMRHQVCRQDDR